MLSVNTNLSSLIVQSNLNQSTNALNRAIERMTTGFKINGAKDNAANYGISTQMSTKISAYEIAEENAMMGLDIIETASSNLDIIDDRLARLRNLQEQALNGTYGEDSLKAINAEVNSLVDEINRLYTTTEYNGVNLFLQNTPKAPDIPDTPQYQTMTANRNTTFEQLGIAATDFSINDKDDNTIISISVEAGDSLGDFFDVLQENDINASISNGVISLTSSKNNYVTGDLATALGISSTEQTYTVSSSQTSTAPVTYDKKILATLDTTLAELGVSSGGDIVIMDKNDNAQGTINIDSANSIGDLFSKLSAYNIEGKLLNGVITLTSSSGNYADGGIIQTLGMGVYNSGTVTLTTTATLSSTISDYYSGSSYSLTVKNDRTGIEESFVLDSNSTFADLQTELLGKDISMTIFDGVMSFTSSSGNYVIGAMMTSLGVNTVQNGNYTVTTANSLTSAVLNYTITTTSTDTQALRCGSFIDDLYFNTDALDASEQLELDKCLTLSEIEDMSIPLEEGSSYKICTLDDLKILAQMNNQGLISEACDFVLMNNIDLSGVDWVSIGTEENPFVGWFLGNGYTISNLSGDSGLFGVLSRNGIICDLELTGVYLNSDKSCVGGLVNMIDSDASSVVLYNCHVNVSAIYNTKGGKSGGLVGYSSSAMIIKSCYVDGSHISSNYNVGGLVGHMAGGGNIEGCYTNIARISGFSEVGGLVGLAATGFNGVSAKSTTNDSVKIIGCYVSAGAVTYDPNFTPCQAVGGLVGTGLVNISNCYVTAKVATQFNCGGIVGLSLLDSNGNVATKINDCKEITPGGSFFTAAITGTNAIINDCTYSTASATMHPTSTTTNLVYDEFARPDFSYTPETLTRTVTVTTTTTADTTASLLTKLSDLNIESGTVSIVTSGTTVKVNYTSDDTIQDFIDTLGTYGISAVLSGGKLSISQDNDAYICAANSNLASMLGIDFTKSYSTSVKPVYKNSSSKKQTISTTYTNKANSTSKELNSKEIATLNAATTMGELGLSGSFTIKSNGKNSVINLSGTSTLNDLLNMFQERGLILTNMDGILTLSGVGICGIANSKLTQVFNFSSVNYSEAIRQVNTSSRKQTYEYELPTLEIDSGVYAPGSFTLQVGINSDASSQIEVETAFTLAGTELLRGIGLDTDNDYLSILDKMISEVSAKQVQLGAAQNRVESALEEINTHYENLVSSRSTLRDADVADESSEYIRNQILQQASATLLATANQSPALALQLL